MVPTSLTAPSGRRALSKDNSKTGINKLHGHIVLTRMAGNRGQLNARDIVVIVGAEGEGRRGIKYNLQNFSSRLRNTARQETVVVVPNARADELYNEIRLPGRGKKLNLLSCFTELS